LARERIIVVEDDKIIAMELRDRLRRWGFVVPATAASGEEAIAAALQWQPDLILMDIWLQGSMDGIQAVEKIHETLDTPIIYVTANADESTLERAKLTEPYGYVLKPFEELELRTTIEIALYKHKLESKLRENEQWLSTTLTSIGDAVIATDEKGLVTFINPVAESLTAIGHDSALGKKLSHIFSIIDESTRAAAGDPAEAALADEAIHRPDRQVLLVSASGAETPIYYNVAPIRDTKGKTLGVVLVFRDINERRRAERLQRALYRISEAANSARDTNALFALVHQIVSELLPAGNFYLALCDHEMRTISFPYFVDEHAYPSPGRQFGPFPFGNGITEFVIRTGLSLLISGDTVRRLAEEGEVTINGSLCRYWLGVPLKTADGHTIGALAVQSYAEGTPYNSQDKDVLDFVSTQIALAIERKRGEQVLKESEERFRTIFARSAIGIGITDIRTQKIIESNEALQKMLGYSAEELQQRSIVDLSHPEDLGLETQQNRDLLDGKLDHYVRDRRHGHKDGRIVWGRVTASLVKDSAGIPMFGISLVEDITQRKAAEEKIREQAALLDHAQDAISVRDLESTIVYWNKGAEQLYGWSPEEALGLNEFDLLCKEITPELGKAQKKVLETGEWVGELSQVTKTGEEVTVQSRWTMVHGPNGDPSSVLVINTNMTDRKKLEAQFLRAQRLESIGTLAGGIAHDLNNVLSPILLAAHLLRSKTTDPAMARWIDTLESSAQRGAGILRQVLTFARGATGKHTALQPKRLLMEMGKITSETFPRSIETTVDLAPDLWPVNGDPTQLHQVLLNLCVNARDAMPNGGILTLAGENVMLDEQSAQEYLDTAPGPYLLISVKDTGGGIPPDVLEKIFEPFFTTKEPGKGTGLGLSTVHAIVKSHKGFIRVNSAPGKGTEFRIFLPANSTGEARQPGEAREESPRGNGELILVVDDETVIQNIIGEILHSYGYRSLMARNGKEGLALYAEHSGKISAVIVDMMMPVMDGATTIRELQRLDPNVRILAMSGVPTEKAGGITRSAVGSFMAKPFTGSTLLTALEELLRGDGSADRDTRKNNAAA
jgi:PAS domain S-box-containing protein